MANIFEELMNHNGSLTESIKPTRVTKESKCNCKKIKANRFRVESIKIFEDADFDQLDTEFAVDVDDNEAKDEVVLVIDPEIPADDEVPEDAAEQLVGDYVYKCPICGANYVCACDAVETEAIEVDEDGVPTECPICGDDADQILVGEIAPVEDVEDTEEEHEMEPVEVEDEEEEVEETEEVEEESLRKTESKRGPTRRRKARESVEVEVKVDDANKVEVKTETDDEVKDEFVDEFETEFEVEGKKSPRRAKKSCEGDECEEKELKESEVSSDLSKYQKWVDYDMKRYGKISKNTQDYLDKAGLEVVKDQYGDYEVTAKYKAEGCKSEGCKEDEVFESKKRVKEALSNYPSIDEMVEYLRSISSTDKYYITVYLPDGAHRYKDYYTLDEVKKCIEDNYDGEAVRTDVTGIRFTKDAPVRKGFVIDSAEAVEGSPKRGKTSESKKRVKESKSLVFANRTFDNLMTKLIRENYKGSPKFVMTKVNLKEGKLYINYTVNSGDKSYKGTLVAEGFRKNASRLTLKMKDKGVFTESYTKEPSFIVECKTINGKITPTSVTYDYTRRVNEQLYRIRGKI